MTSRFLGIQGLRFVAAFLVVVTHSTFYAHERLVPDLFVWRGGTVGVDIFFVISGFVMMITSPTFVSTKGGWKYFGMRRLVRIVPMYWIATTLKIATMLILPGAVLHAALTPWAVFSSYFFLPNQNPEGNIEPLLGVGWTLTFEMFFYVVFALGLLLRVNVYIFSSVIMVLFAAGKLLRGDGDWPAWAVYFDQIVLYFVIGMTVAKLAMSQNARRLLLYALGIATAVLVITALFPDGVSWHRNAPFRMAAVAIIFVLVVFAEPLLKRVIPRPILFMGDASYSLYLFHPMIAPVVPVALAVLNIQSGLLSVTGSIVLAIITAALIYRFVEKPLMSRLRNLPYAGRIPAAVSGTSPGAKPAVSR